VEALEAGLQPIIRLDDLGDPFSWRAKNIETAVAWDARYNFRLELFQPGPQSLVLQPAQVCGVHVQSLL
jgi:hypothetical protein